MNTMTLNTKEAARQLGLAPNTLEKMRVAGSGIPYVRLGRVVRYRVSDLEAYLAERVVSSTSEKNA